MIKQTNLAYDLSRYEYQTPKEETKPIIRAKRIGQKNAAAPKFILCSLFAGVMLCAMLYGKTEASSLCNDINIATKQYEILSSENKRMKSEIDGKSSSKNVENYAENVLGLQKLDKSQIEYVQLESETEVQIPKTSPNIFVQIKNKFAEIVEYLRG
ncbi:MAG: hypothetical protein RR540_07185 [Oscillospiraceae bacterium]